MRHLLGLCCCVALAGCATFAVAPGHRAVLMDDRGRYAVLDEGAHAVPSGATIDDFDLRAQTLGGTFGAVTADGVPVVVHDPSITYALDADQLVAIDRALGRGVGPLVAAETRAAIGAVLSTYRAGELDAVHLRAAQERMRALAAERLRPRHVVLISVELKGVVPRLPALAAAVTETSGWEQRSLAAPSGIALARQDADRLRADAAGIAAAHRQLAPTLTPLVLAEARVRAWRALLASPTTTLEVSP